MARLIAFVGIVLAAAALIAVLFLIMTSGLGGMFLAIVVVALIGAAWANADEKRYEAQYRKDMQ